ncbi:seleno O-like isoform X1 [Labeo rohita]|uniref:Selenoprotein O n=1 Tax=Labeo rohita TaxID=84645 RepID=A0A498MN82_LABRO|nr:seleno O-like isoform X1 [Labeo rohita]
MAQSITPLQRLKFNNVALKKLPLDSSLESGSRTVTGACFSRVQPQPLLKPTVVALSEPALALLGLTVDDVLRDPHGAEYLSGSRVIPGSEPAAHCYCGHQFGNFAGQLGDGAVCYLGEVEAGAKQSSDPSNTSPCGRQSDGRKVLRSSIREFLSSEAMFALGIPTTRAGSLVTSDLYVQRDAFYSGNPRPERFGSFEIFHPVDDFTGRHGPSIGRPDIRAQLLDYVIETFYPEIQRRHSDRQERNASFFREVTVRTAKLVALWQSVGFCHGVLNTDNMSILGLTIDYGPFGFMDRFDPEFVCNASDKKGRYSYEAQPYVCHWNLARLAEALGAELQSAKAGAILDEFMTIYQDFYLGNMRMKLGLLRKQEPEDLELVADLLKTMHITGADFTNTFRQLSAVSCPVGEQKDRDSTDSVVELIVGQCASLEELKVANHPTMQPGELEMILSMAETNPGMFNMVANQPEVTKQLDKIGRRRLARECDKGSDPAAVEKERVRSMNSTNPAVVLRNYIAQNAIEAAERGDFSEVQQLLKVLENPYSVSPDLERPVWAAECGSDQADGNSIKGQEAKENTKGKAAADTHQIPYNSKPPAWARTICVT